MADWRATALRSYPFPGARVRRRSLGTVVGGGSADAAASDLLPAPVAGGARTGPLRWVGKRGFDVVAALALLALLAPLLAVTALVVLVDDGRPVLYRQRRVGYRGDKFSILKFRSMEVDAERLQVFLADSNSTDGLLFKLYDDPRVTRVGRVLRRWSLDEIPQLLNVLRGEMSLVGPRPLAVEPGEFGARASTRHLVLPGITGPWQVSKHELGYEGMISLDLDYVSSRSFGRDLAILARTLPALARRQQLP